MKYRVMIKRYSFMECEVEGDRNQVENKALELASDMSWSKVDAEYEVVDVQEIVDKNIDLYRKI